MSRKAFIIWGLVIIQLSVTASAVLMYLTLSEVIGLKSNLGIVALGQFFGPIIILGVILHLRFKQIGRRKRILAFCIFLYLFSLTTINYPAMLYNDYVVMNSDTHAQFWQAAYDWTKSDTPESMSRWTAMQKIKYVSLDLPAYYLVYWSLFALLWFGSLDPRTPSKNRIVQFFKTGFPRKAATNTHLEGRKLAPV